MTAEFLQFQQCWHYNKETKHCSLHRPLKACRDCPRHHPGKTAEVIVLHPKRKADVPGV